MVMMVALESAYLSCISFVLVGKKKKFSFTFFPYFIFLSTMCNTLLFLSFSLVLALALAFGRSFYYQTMYPSLSGIR